jgi:hypothetical protein
MRQAGYPIAGGVLDQRALNVQADSEAARQAEEEQRDRHKSSSTLKWVAAAAAVGGVLVAIVKK